MKGLNNEQQAAIRQVNDLIAWRTAELREIAKTEDADPILIEGETSTGHFCQMMVDSKDVAEIALAYNYPVWQVLGEDYPEGMWEDLGRKFGLASVISMGL